MKQKRNQLLPQAVMASVSKQQPACSINSENSTCTQPHTAEMDLIKPEARFYNEFSWNLHLSSVNKDETFSKDTAHKTSKPVLDQP